jgi:hypothetical protein
MKLQNPKDSALDVELFVAPGEWFKLTLGAGEVGDVPDELSAAAMASHGLVVPVEKSAPKPKAKAD